LMYPEIGLFLLWMKLLIQKTIVTSAELQAKQ